ncbi:hypothetical protein KGF57_003110 [Candida theae]|uniref:ER membrane protein complex subunit 10 n=1 Tax=Candida theae TaxID=1198502 RepID=A0AAD5BEI9_9ASCO|nr:uncharacterized protein KGF57_003110 [Candida theae]KAI5957843.1 hypothetical protein KGF57_003110 [Candida theae]
MISIVKFISWALLISAVSSKRVNLFIRPLDGTESNPIGYIENELVYLMETDLQKEYGYCIGTKDIHHHDCFSYHTNLANLSHAVFHLFLDGDGDVERLSLSFDDKLNEPKVVKHKILVAPGPNLTPASINKPREEQKNGGGGEGIEVPVDNRSWIQKNWMYVVPPLIIFMFAGGGGGGAATAEQGS